MDTIGTLQVHKEAASTLTRGKVKPIQIYSPERRGIDEDTIADLIEVLTRDRRFLHPIVVRAEAVSRYRLIAGHHRLEAWKRRFGNERPIRAIIYPSDTPDALITVLEIEENLLRKELTAAEREIQTIQLAVAIRKLNGGEPATPISESGEVAESGNLVPSLAPASGGRGNKGLAQKVAEKAGITKRAVNKRVKAAEEAISEKIDLDRDTPEELERKAQKLQHADRKVVHLKPRKAAPRVEDPTPAESQAGEIDSEIEEVWRAFIGLSARKQLAIILRACRLRGWALRVGRARRAPAVDEEPELAVDSPTEVAPTTDDAPGAHAQQRGDAADVGAEDLQDASAAVSQVADQEPELAVDIPAEVAPATNVPVDSLAEPQDDAANLGAEHLQNADVGGSEAANQEPGGATKCASCTMEFYSSDERVMIYGRPYHADLCAKFAKPPIAIAA
jgi:ParB-like chromosome segregation protein Spo0J